MEVILLMLLYEKFRLI